MNTALATGRDPGPAFADWHAYVAANPDLDCARLMARACPHLSATEAAVARDIFGVPTMFVGSEMFFGKDSLTDLEIHLRNIS